MVGRQHCFHTAQPRSLEDGVKWSRAINYDEFDDPRYVSCGDREPINPRE